MGSELVSGSAPTPPKSVSYSSAFDEWFPFYLSVGMSATEYWDGDSLDVIGYRKAYEMQRERRNQELWLQGAYFYTVMVSVAPMYQTFNKKPQPAPYMKEPFPLTAKAAREQKEAEERARYEAMLKRMQEFRRSFNQSHKEGNENA